MEACLSNVDVSVDYLNEIFRGFSHFNLLELKNEKNQSPITICILTVLENPTLQQKNSIEKLIVLINFGVTFGKHDWIIFSVISFENIHDFERILFSLNEMASCSASEKRTFQENLFKCLQHNLETCRFRYASIILNRFKISFSFLLAGFMCSRTTTDGLKKMCLNESSKLDQLITLIQKEDIIFV